MSGPAGSAGPAGPAGTNRERPRARAGTGLIGIVLINVVAPWLVYLLLRPHVSSDAEALAAGGAIPAAWLLVRLVLARTVAWLALVSVAVFAVSLVASLLSGGSALPLKVHASIFSGAVGLACLISVAARRPLPVLLARVPALYDADRGREIEQILGDPVRRRRLTVITVMAGVTFLVDAAARVVLAITLSTASFLVISKIASWGIIACGLALIVLYLRHGRRRGDGGDTPHSYPRPVGMSGAGQQRP